MRLMFARGYGHKEIENLFRFIEIMLELSNDDLNNKIYAELKEIVKEEDKMVITKFEEMAMEKGIEKGIEKGKFERNIEIARNLLNINMPVEQIALVTGMKPEEIQKLSEEMR